MERFDLVVIGGGSAGLKAARTAARAGHRAALAEERELGGECFWAGCVPTKALVRAADVWRLVRESAPFGIDAEVRCASYAEAQAYKERAVRAVGGNGSPDGGLSKIGVHFYPSRATLLDPHRVRIGGDVVHGDRIILATGTIPHVPYVEGLEETGYITNREAVGLPELPKRMIVLGGGPIGLEFAQVFQRFGAEVTVIEHGDQILAREDAQVAELATDYLCAEGMRILTSARATRVWRDGNAKVMAIDAGGKRETLMADEILVAAGRAAAIGDLDLDAAAVPYSHRAIGCDGTLRTNQPHIWVAGDCAGGYLFTHVASFEGRLAAMNAFSDSPKEYNPRVVPRATFIDPEVASIGHTEAQAIEAGLEVAAHSFLFADLDRAILHGDTRGVVKLVIESRTGQIVGAHIIGPHASSILPEIALAMQHHLPVSAIAETMHLYPSFPEAVEAAALATPRYVGKVETG